MECAVISHASRLCFGGIGSGTMTVSRPARGFTQSLHRMMRTILRTLVAAILASTLTFASAKVIDNVEIEKLLSAGMDEDVIVTIITSAKEKQFDTSAEALSAIKAKGATPAIIKAMVGAGTTGSEAEPAAEKLSIDDVFAVVDGKRDQLGYIQPEIAARGRAMGFGGAGWYGVVKGGVADRPLPADVSFIAVIPKSAQANSYFTLANLGLDRNGDRYILVANSGMSGIKFGIPKERVVAFTATKAVDQSQAGKDAIVYELRLKGPLAAGQYALIRGVSTTGFGQMTGFFYDFSVK